MFSRLSRCSLLIAVAIAGAIASALANEPASKLASEGRAPRPQRPNILWICTDQQRYDTIHALGNKYIRTPNLDSLVKSGVAFTHAHCQSPICTPSRASFLTGRYPETIRACINGNDQWADAAPLITKTLADTGYDCGLAGKLHLSRAKGRIERRPDDGYRVFHWSHHPYPDWPEGHAYDTWLKRQGVDFKKTYRKNDRSMPARWHQTTWCADRAIDFIKEKRNGPWLFSLNCFDPHPPLDPPKKYLARFDVDSLPGPLFRPSDLEAQARLKGVRFQTKAKAYDEHEARLHQARYWAQIELIDENVGRLLNVLDETGQRDNTIVIFTSDHGEALGDHGLRAKGCRFYEGLVRVPLITSWPGGFKQNLRSDALVELVDIAPTLLEAANLPVSDAIQGRSLTPILTGRSNPNEHRDFVRCVYFAALPGPPTRATMIRTKDYKLVRYHHHEPGELFDLRKDPGEFDNQWSNPEYREIRQTLLEKSLDAAAEAIDIGPRRTGRF
jgi:arylsulfatase A-like enzyme